MNTKVTVDSAGRLVIPKAIRERYGLKAGTELELVAEGDGIALVPSRVEHRFVRVGRVVAVDTGAGYAPADVFDVASMRTTVLDQKQTEFQ
ncbi:MAG: AbrB/MazE/SpoVT family DNA-binding domain-containing protein [Spirochaetaceae bacterium]|nr:MAG: AbrB/MazE/SpoVT family DNA-binding domain-containing protein [Spirochaetaceae bacterium]